MDDIVHQAMAKWPSVPHCYGWLGLDSRGNWYMRDDAAQRAGSFAGGQPGAKGNRVEHAALIAFIQRNYAQDPTGQWYFQNGPQRVYVELAVTPWIWRVADDLAVSAHDGTPAAVRTCLVDQHGWLYLAADIGFGLVHTQDMQWAAQAVESGLWTPEGVRAEDLPGRYGYVCSPERAQQKQ